MRKLPDEAQAQAREIIGEEARSAMADIAAAYPVNTKLASGLRLEDRSKSGAPTLRVFTDFRVTPEADYLEYGTQVRHTALGASRGAIEPPRPTFIPIADRHRRVMWRRLVALVNTFGFEVDASDLL